MEKMNRGAAVASMLTSGNQGSGMAMDNEPSQETPQTKPTEGTITIDSALFPSLADKKVGDMAYLTVKIDKIQGRQFEVSPYKEDSEEESPEGTIQPSTQEQRMAGNPQR